LNHASVPGPVFCFAHREATLWHLFAYVTLKPKARLSLRAQPVRWSRPVSANLTVYELPPSRYERVRPLFASDRYDEPFRDEVFEGKLTFPVFADDPDNPTAAMICHPFEFYLGGAVSPALRMFCKDAPEEPGAFQRFYGFATAGAAWKDALLADTPLTVIERRNFKWPMDKPAPDWQAKLPDGAQLVWMNRAMAERADRELDEHISGQWGGYDNYERYGAGFCLLMDGRLTSVAYALAASNRHLNIGVKTAAGFRRQGLASIVCAALIEHALQRGLQPAWCSDALNHPSCELALRLGFEEDMSFVEIGPGWGNHLVLSRGLWSRGETRADGVTVWQRA